MQKGAERLPAFPRENPEASLLISENNPNGWAIDELLARVRVELEAQLREMDTRRPEIKQKRLAYDQVVAALWEAEGRYRVLGTHQD